MGYAGDGGGHDRGEFRVGQQHFRFGMSQDELDRRGVKADVDGTQDGTEHRDGVVGFEHLRGVGRHDRHGIPLPYSGFRQRGCEAARS